MNTKDRNRLLTMLRDCLRDGRDVIRRYEHEMRAGDPPRDIEPLRIQMAELQSLEQALLYDSICGTEAAEAIEPVARQGRVCWEMQLCTALSVRPGSPPMQP